MIAFGLLGIIEIFINPQKVSLVSFNEIIIKDATNRLQDDTDSCALMLFRGGSSAQMLCDFLTFRSEAVGHIMPQNGINASDSSNRGVLLLM